MLKKEHVQLMEHEDITYRNVEYYLNLMNEKNLYYIGIELRKEELKCDVIAGMVTEKLEVDNSTKR
jgi:hypothetical protein